MPELIEFFEQSLAGLVDPSIFRRAASRPAPSFRAAGGLALAAGASALAVGFARASISYPGLFRQFSPFLLVAAVASALVLYAFLLLMLAVVLHRVGNAFGGKGEFARGLQAAAMISVLAPLQMLCGGFSIAWAAPALLAAWAASSALSGLFNARRGPVRIFCAVLAAAGIGLQAAGRALADRAYDAHAAVQTLKEGAEANADLALSISALAQQAQPADAAPGSPPPTSSLELLRGGLPPEDAGSAPAARPLGESAAPGGSAQAMPANAAGMLDALRPMLEMLANSKTLASQQKTDVKELQGLMQELKTQMISGKPMDSAVFSKKMSRYQTLLMRVMRSSSRAQPGNSDAPR